jgi:tetratricopeptide (TPR) repeat protein
VAKEAESIEGIGERAEALAETGNARALAGDAEGARADLHGAALMAEQIKDYRTRAGTLATIGLGLARARDAAGSHDAFRDALQATDAIDNLEFRSRVLADIALAQARGGDTPAARETFAEALRCVEAIEARDKHPERTSHLFDRELLIGKLAEIGLVVEARRMAEEAGLFRREKTLQGILIILDRALKNASRVDGRLIVDWVRQRVDAIQREVDGTRAPRRPGSDAEEREAIRRDLLRWIAKAEAKWGDFDAAIRAAESIGGKDRADPSRIETLLAVAVARIDAGEKDAARDLLRELFDRLTAPRGPTPGPPDCGTLLEIAEAQARVGDLDGVKRTVAALPEVLPKSTEPPPPDVAEIEDPALDLRHRREMARIFRTRGLALVAAARAVCGDAAGALGDCRGAIDRIKTHRGPQLPVLETWEKIIEAQALAGDVAAVVRTANLAADALYEEPREEPDVIKTLRSREEQDRDNKEYLLWSAVYALLKAGDLAGALRLFDADTEHLSWLELRFLILDHARAGDVDAALALLDRLPGPSERAAILLRIAEVVSSKKSMPTPKPGP